MEDKFKDEKYEVVLHIWGGFWNKHNKEKHNIEQGNYFFDSRKEAETYLKEIRGIADSLGTKDSIIAHSIEEGKHVRYRTLAKMTFKKDNKKYPYEYDFGYAYPVEAAEFMFHDGNYGCDCNRSLFIQEQDKTFPKHECGEDIEVLNFVVLQVKDSTTEKFMK
jgi:hypothetical protein